MPTGLPPDFDGSSYLWGISPMWAFTDGVQAGEVLVSARTHLNDDEGILWPDHKLFPKLREAHRQLQLHLIQNGVPITKSVSQVITVPTDSMFDVIDCSLINNYPGDLLVPIWLKERSAGQRDEDFVDMIEVDFLPQLQPSDTLTRWTWENQRIKVIRPTQEREVLIRYRAYIRNPLALTDPVGPFFGELYLSYKTAALAVGSLTPRDTERIAYLEGQASSNLDNILANAAIQAQGLPTKRRPYHRGRSRL